MGKPVEKSKEQYDRSVRTVIENGKPWSEQEHGSRRTLYVNNIPVATTADSGSLDIGNITNQQFASFLGNFNKTLYSQFIAHPELYTLKVQYKGVSKSKNNRAWDSLPVGAFFDNIDLKSAYWQMTYKLGYITPTLYQKYLWDDRYKQVKRYCISFLGRPNKRTHNNGSEKIIMRCDTQPLKQVYDNVRQGLYCVIFESLASIPDYIEYNIDGVTVMEKDTEKIKKYFKNLGLEYKTTKCRKLSDNEYYYGSKIRKFKPQIYGHKNIKNREMRVQ